MRMPVPLKAGFVRDSAALIAGAGIAQLAIVAATPIITRLYDQRTWGVLAAFIALTARWTNRLLALRTGDHDCERRRGARAIRLSMAVNVLVALVFGLLIWFQGQLLLKWSGLESIADWIWLAPPGCAWVGDFPASASAAHPSPEIRQPIPAGWQKCL